MLVPENQTDNPLTNLAENRLDTGLVLTNKPPLEKNPAAVYLASLSPSGCRTQRTALDTIARMLTGDKADAFSCDWANVRYQHSAAIRSKLANIFSPATTNKLLCALRRVLKETWRLGYITAEAYQRAADVENVQGETLPAGRELNMGELTALMSACNNDSSPAGARDAALIALLYASGLRRDEAARLTIEDYDSTGNRFLVHGKRKKQRYIYLPEGASQALTDWLLIRGNLPGALFFPINKKGKIFPRKVSNQAIYNILVKRGKQAQTSKFSPHDLRRTFVSDLLAAGADIAVVSKMAGHANVQTTARYDRRPEEVKRKSAHLLHVPYQKRT